MKTVKTIKRFTYKEPGQNISPRRPSQQLQPDPDPASQYPRPRSSDEEWDDLPNRNPACASSEALLPERGRLRPTRRRELVQRGPKRRNGLLYI